MHHHLHCRISATKCLHRVSKDRGPSGRSSRIAPGMPSDDPTPHPVRRARPLALAIDAIEPARKSGPAARMALTSVLSRDGGTRTHDLSVTKATGATRPACTASCPRAPRPAGTGTADPSEGPQLTAVDLSNSTTPPASRAITAMGGEPMVAAIPPQ